MIPASRLVDLAHTRVGQRYVLGCRVPYDDPTWDGPWDCAELVTWAVRQLTGELVGVTSAGEAYSGAWASIATGRIPVDVACATVGAVLVRAPGIPGRSGHVALSAGAGRTVEAYSSTRGVIESSSLGRRWDVGILVSGLGYELAPPISSSPPAVLRAGAKGADVLRLQSRLRGLGHDPGPLDGIFGPQTTRAVVDAQVARGLVADGEVGPITRAALGL